MVSAIDGAECQPGEISVRPEDYSILKQRLVSILRGLEQLHQASSLCCLTCSAISRRRVQHVGGCPATFNLCFKCLGAHHGQSCTGQYFNVKKKFCFKCWMPAFDIFGISFHGNSKEELVRCNNAARNFLKPLAMCFYHKRITLSLSYSGGDISHYQEWLFSGSQESVSGSGQLPNIVLLLEAALLQMKPVFE